MFQQMISKMTETFGSGVPGGGQRPSGVIEFLCEPSDMGVIAEPVPAKLAMPEWFKRLPAVDKSVVSASNNGLTVKRCMPFLDAMTLGFILPLAASVRLQVMDGGQKVDAGWEFDKTMVSNHGSYQVSGHPFGKRPPMKFHNYWTIKTPPGWSCLFVAPLNRPQMPVEIIAGVVDTDSYASLINFPFFATGEDGVHKLEKGTPLVQVIPFRREDATSPPMSVTARDDRLRLDIRKENNNESNEREIIRRNTMSVEGWYRKFSRSIR